MNRFLPLLREWLAAVGRWRLLFALATAVALAALGPQLAATRKPPFDMAVLKAVHAAIPDAIGPVLLGCARAVHILTPSATVRRIVNMTALAVVDAVQR